MSGFWADEDLSPDAIELARRQVQARPEFIDLTSSNPTQQRPLFPPEILRAGNDQVRRPDLLPGTRRIQRRC